MRKLYSTGVVLKVTLFIVCYLSDVTMSSTGSNPDFTLLHQERRQLFSDSQKEFPDLGEFNQVKEGIESMMEKFDIKGASIAVARNDQLIFATGLGYADTESGEPVSPEHLFRVASISKLITATTIMKMIELDLLDIDDKVFGKNGILNDPKYLKYADRRVEMITVRHLLTHSSGWNSRQGDPLTRHHFLARRLKVDVADVRVSDIISYALEQNLHFNPGSRTSYSNLGYAVLGEIIEKISGIEYEAYVRQKILLPLGIQKMRIGRNFADERYDNEVKYYDLASPQRSSPRNNQAVPLAYGGNDIEILGAAGGWIASPVDILKLVIAIDPSSGGLNILLPETMRLMTDIRLSGGNPIGWAGTDGRGNWWRTGTLAGTSALVMRQNDGISWAVFFNSSTIMGTRLPIVTHREMQAALNKIDHLPEHDLFDYFQPSRHFHHDLAQLQ
jgi:CubicO group peptidase (beta-lactamase class C family)